MNIKKLDEKLENIKEMQKTLVVYGKDLHTIDRSELISRLTDVIRGYKGTLRGVKHLLWETKLANKMNKVKIK